MNRDRIQAEVRKLFGPDEAVTVESVRPGGFTLSLDSTGLTFTMLKQLSQCFVTTQINIGSEDRDSGGYSEWTPPSPYSVVLVRVDGVPEDLLDAS